MELLYLYIDAYRGLHEKEFNFAHDLHFHYKKDKDTGEVVVKRNEEYEELLPKNFWGERISNLSVIVGNNGAGKTSVMHCLIDFLRYVVDRPNKGPDGSGVILFRDDGNNYLLKIENSRNLSEKSSYKVSFENFNCFEMDLDSAAVILSKTKLIYITNILNRADYNRAIDTTRRYTFLYDCSLGALLIGGIHSSAYSGKSSEDMREGSSYFFYETYRQVQFIFDEYQYNKLIKLNNNGHQIPMPTKLKMQIKANLDIDFNDKQVNPYTEWAKFYATPWENFFFPYSYELQRKQSYSNYVLLKYTLARNCIWTAFRMLNYRCDNVFHGPLFDKAFNVKVDDMAKKTDNAKKEIENLPEKSELQYEEFYFAIDVLFNTYKNVFKNRNISEEKKQETLKLKKFYTKFIDMIRQDKLKNLFKIESFSTTDVYVSMESWQSNKHKQKMFMLFLDVYNNICRPDYFMDFYWDLSSGENSMLSLLTSLYRVLDEVKSTANSDKQYCIFRTKDKDINDVYKNIILLIDEADLTYHPEWQRQFISLLTTFLPEIYSRPITIQVVLTTHSPIILSDIPKSNVIYMDRIDQGDARESHKENTFGQNIHTLFIDSFEENPIGEFAKRKIDAVTDYLNGDSIAIKNMQEARMIIDLIGENVVKKTLLSKYNAISNVKNFVKIPIELTTAYEELTQDQKRTFIQYIIDSQGAHADDKN